MKILIIYLILLIFSSPTHAVSNLSLKGNWTQGGLLQGKTEPNAKIYFQKKPVKVSPQGDFLIGFHRDEPLASILKIVLSNGKIIKKNIKISKREYRVQRIDGLPPGKVNPRKPETIKRINQESALIKKARKRNDDRFDYQQKFIWPVTGPISGVYGSQRILNGEPRRPHYGIDIARATGTQVVAPAAGIITVAHKDMFFSGGTIMLDHGYGLSSSFLHLSKLYVNVGDSIKQGQLIAEVGATGRVTGAHLDWRMNLFNKRIDPELLVPPMPANKNQ